MAEFKELQQRALMVRRAYAGHERERYGRSWTGEELMLGFAGDVGDLAKLVAAAEGVRSIADVKSKLAHELADCLWSVLVLADAYAVDLEASFESTMMEVEGRLGA